MKSSRKLTAALTLFLIVGIGAVLINEHGLPELNLASVARSLTATDPGQTAALAISRASADVIARFGIWQSAAPENRSREEVALLSSLFNRKREILAAMEANPTAVLGGTLPLSIVERLPLPVRDIVEAPRRLTGTLEISIADNFTQGQSTIELILEERSTGNLYNLHLTDLGRIKADFETGDLVQVAGLALEDHLVARDTDVILAQGPTSPLATTSGPTIKKILVFLLNFKDDDDQPITTDFARKVIFNGDGSVNKLYQNESFGKWSLEGQLNQSGDIHGWFTLPIDGTCDLPTIRSEVNKLAENKHINLDGYDNIVYITTRVDCDGITGRGNVNGRHSWINPNYDYSYHDVENEMVNIIAHELGHNYGFGHAGALDCTENGTRVSISNPENCHEYEYLDYSSVMGATYSFTSYQHNRFHRQYYWFPSRNVKTIERASGAYSALIQSGNNPASPSGFSAVRLPRTTTSNGRVLDYYYLDFRPMATEDDWELNGVSVRIVPTNPDGYTPTWLIDTTPKSSYFTSYYPDDELTAGNYYYDPYSDLTIKTVTTDPDYGAQVVVVFGPPEELPKLELTKPLGASSYFKNQSVPVTWSIENAPGGAVKLSLVEADTGAIRVSTGLLTGRNYNFNLADFALTPGDYQLIAELSLGGSTVAVAKSSYLDIRSESLSPDSPSINLVSPAGGAYVLDQTIRVNWVTDNAPDGATTYLRLTNSIGSIITGAAGLGASQFNAYDFNLAPLNLPPGVYNFSLLLRLGSNTVASDMGKSFLLVPLGERLPPRPINLAKLNSFLYRLGQNVPLAWSLSSANPSDATVTLNLRQVSDSSRLASNVGLLGENYSFPLQVNNLSINSTYRFDAELWSGGKIIAVDSSDNFKVAGSLDPTLLEFNAAFPPDFSIDMATPAGLGWSSVGLHSTHPIVTTSLPAESDFAVTSMVGNPKVQNPGQLIEVNSLVVVPSNPYDLAIEFSRPMQPGERIRLTYKPTGYSVCLGFLPGDANQDSFTNYADFSTINHWLNDPAGIEDARRLPLTRKDFNRDSKFDGKDMADMFRYLVSTQFAIGQRLPPCP